MNRAALRICLALAVVALAPSARASDPFPEVIKAQLKLSEAPLCTVCHATLIGGLMTVTKPFGRNLMQKYGLRALDIPGLQNAIMKAQENGDDSDGDGVGDIAELIQGTDPNVPEGGVAVDEPRYGCYCSVPAAHVDTRAGGVGARGWAGVAPSSTAAAAAWVSGLVLAGLRRRAVRRARAQVVADRRGRPVRGARVETKS